MLRDQRCLFRASLLYLRLAALSKLLTLCAFHPGGSLLRTTCALLGCTVEKESKLEVMRCAGKELVTLLQVCEMSGYIRAE